jgi:hypothetical protein
MGNPRRWLARLAVAAIAPIAAGTLSIAPASASDPSCHPAVDLADVCVHVFEGTVYGSIAAEGGTSEWFEAASVYVTQCRPDITNCGVIAANNGGLTAEVLTSEKPAPSGHVFHACASWTDSAGHHHVNVCSPWRSSP